jgi:uncharacterized protein (TIGR02596 family)
MRVLSTQRFKFKGFSLVELLLVLAMVSILMMIVVGPTRRTWEGQEVKASALKLAHDLALASQTATRLNTTVEVRFYQFNDIGISSNEAQFRAYQLIERVPLAGATGTNGSVHTFPRPIFEVQRFEGNTVMSSRTKYSSLAGGRTTQRQPTDPELGIGNYTYASVEFRPDGTTDLEPPGREPWTISLGPLRWIENPLVTPKDIQCIGIDWATGAVRIF